MSEAMPFAALLGRRLRERRLELGLRQDDVARRCAYRYGLPLTRSVIDAIERGTRDLTIPEVAVILAVLGMSLEDALGGGGVVALSDVVAVRADKLVDQLVGRRATWAFATRSPQTGRLTWRTSLSGYVHEVGDAEQKIGRRLDVTPEVVAEAAHKLWGRSLTDERDRRVGEQASEDATPRTLRALRGHVTRALLAELEPAVRDLVGGG